jgi:hypothetical protein
VSKSYRYTVGAKIGGDPVPSGMIAYTRKDGITVMESVSEIDKAIKEHELTEYYIVMTDDSLREIKVKEAGQ